MKSSDLNKLFKGLFTGHELKETIHGEVSSYCELMKKRGASIPLKFLEDEEIIIDCSAIERLLQEALSKRLSNADLAYICDCLTLGNKVDYTNEKTKDMIFEIADPEINGGFKTDDELRQLINACKESS